MDIPLIFSIVIEINRFSIIQDIEQEREHILVFFFGFNPFELNVEFIDCIIYMRS